MLTNNKHVREEVCMRAEDLQRSELLTIDERTGFPMLGPYRLIIAGMAGFASLRNDLIKSIGMDNMFIIMSRYGYSVGIAWASAVAEMYDFESPEEWLRVCEVFLTMSGAAHVNFESIVIDKEKKLLRCSGTWTESFITALWRLEHGPSDTPICVFMTGVISGYASAVLGSEVMVKELTCEAQGHPHCSFEGRSAEEWGLKPEEVRERFDLRRFEAELFTLHKALRDAHDDMNRQREEINLLKSQRLTPHADDEFIFRSDSIAHLLFLAERVAPTESTVLIEGESGTGKEVLAQFIHHHSGRSSEPLLAINCAALPANLLESELFGHVKGSFTGADRDKTGLFKEAGTGTLFLDEVGELPLELQAKLLRAVQEKKVRPVGGLKDLPVRARIIAATNRDLKEMVQAGNFREDLYYRLAVFPLSITPLRERRQDILLLARYFLQRLKHDHPGFAPSAVRKLEAYSWPGNVRELENWIEYAVVMAGDELIQPDHLPLATMNDAENLLSGLASDLPTLEELEHRYIEQILHHTKGNRTEAARILGTSISTLWRRLKEKSPTDRV